MDWPADGVERVAVAKLIPSARNARTHSDAQVAQIAASVREWGWTVPILLDEAGNIIAGHGRVLAARLLGVTEVPAMVARGWTQVQIAAYRIADNKLTLNGGWDDELLKAEFADLDAAGFDLGLTGFGDWELAALRDSNPGLTDPDEVPEPPVVPVSQRGDVWQLGRHRLLCGDATNADDVAKVLGGAKPHLMVTDPPYGVDYDPNWRNEAAKHSAGMGNRIGITATGTVANDSRADWTEAWQLFPGDIAYVWHGGIEAAMTQRSLVDAGFAIRSQIIWVKQHFAFGRSNYHWQHEPCWYAVKNSARWSGGRAQSTVWSIENNNPMGHRSEREVRTGHGTQKPVECMKRPIENNSAPGQAVYDPFVGSGTTIIAAEMTGRACHAIEIDPVYIDVCITRWQNFTGERATLGGRTFHDMAAQRRQEAA